MDTRLKNKQSRGEEEPKTSMKALDDENYIIRTDKINTDESYMEATIYNLVKRFECLDYIESRYEQELQQQDVTPQFLKFYIHSSYTLPGIVISLAYLRYKKKLTMNSFLGTLCFASVFNEWNRSLRMRALSREKAKEYDEHTDNYRTLFRSYVKFTSFSDIVKYGFRVDPNNQVSDWRRYNLNDNFNNKIMQDIYY